MMGDGQFKPGVAAIIIIAIGILIFTLLFIFTKRQIMRLAQKFPTDGLHAPIGYEAPKNLCQKIEHRLNSIRNIQYEPLLINPDNQYSCEENVSIYKHIYRMKAVDSVKELEDFIVNSCGKDESKRRHPGHDLQTYLLNLQKDDGPLSNCDSTLINEFVNGYFHARCDTEPDFGQEEYKKYTFLLDKLKSQIIPRKSLTKSSPTKILQRKSITKGLTTNLSFKNLTSLSSTLAKDGSKLKTDETCV